MRKLLYLFLLIPFFSISQIGTPKSLDEKVHVGYNNNMTKFHSLSYTVNDDNTKHYHLHYRNMEYQNIDTYESIFFDASDDELEYFYNFLKEAMIDKTGKSLNIGDSQIVAKKKGKAVSILNVTPDKVASSFWLLSKDLQRLFGKRK